MNRVVAIAVGCVLLCSLALGLANCNQTPYRVFAVQVAGAPPPPDDPPPTPPVTSLVRPMPNAHALAAAPSRTPFDLNAASGAELGRIPGMTTTVIAALIAGRPYRSKRELVKRKILTAAQYDAWKGYLVVHRSHTAPASAHRFEPT